MSKNLNYAWLDTGLFSNKKIVRLLAKPNGEHLLLAWLRLVLWARNDADPENIGEAGQIDAAVAAHLLGPDFAGILRDLQDARLVEQGLDPDVWWLHEYADHQDLAGWLARQARNRRGGQARGEQLRAQARAQAEANGQPTLDPGLEPTHHPRVRALPTQPNPTQTEVETKTVSTSESGRARRATRLPTDWMPDKPLRQWAAEHHPEVDARAQTDQFRDYWHAKSGQSATKLDWDATWRNWIRRAAEHAPPRRYPPADPIPNR